MHIVRYLDETVWRDFVDRQPAGNIFHTPEMFRVLASTKGYKPTLWAAVDDSAQVQALLLANEVTLFNGPLQRITTRAVVYGSALAAPGPGGEAALETLLKSYSGEKAGSILFTELRNLSDLAAIQPALERCGFVYEEHLNYLIDLRRSDEEVFKEISSRTRSYIRRALRDESIVLKEIADRAQLRDCYELMRLTYQNAQVPLADFSLFESAFDQLCPLDMVRFTAVYYEQKPIAVSADLFYKDVIYYWYGGMDRAHGSLHPNELIRWHVLQQGIENGYGLFDFGGAGKPNQKYGVRDFKAKFGGDLVNYGRNIREHSPRLLRISALGYSVVRRWL